MGRKYDDCPFIKIHSDCFALQMDGRCFCLDDTEFRDKVTCPFYKTAMDVDNRVVARVQRLNEEIGRRRKVI